METKDFEKLTLNQMRRQLKKELIHILILSAIIWMIGLFAIINFGWKLGGFIGLLIWLIVLLVIKE